jgi:hypothetical protein
MVTESSDLKSSDAQGGAASAAGADGPAAADAMARTDQTTEARPAAPKGVKAMLSRIALGAAGLGLLVGFFMPWLKLGAAMTVSGFGLMLSAGEVVEALTGPHRMLLFAIPMFGLALLGAAVFAPRFAGWVGLVAGTLIIVYGLVTVISVFLAATGAGMWIVVFASLGALVAGVLGLARSK